MAHLNADISVVYSIANGRAFHCRVPITEKALSEFCTGARYVKPAGVGRSEPATAKKIRRSEVLVVVFAMV